MWQKPTFETSNSCVSDVGVSDIHESGPPGVKCTPSRPFKATPPPPKHADVFVWTGDALIPHLSLPTPTGEFPLADREGEPGASYPGCAWHLRPLRGPPSLKSSLLTHDKEHL